MAFKLLDGATAIGASRAVLVGKKITDHTNEAELVSLAVTAISAATVILQGATRQKKFTPSGGRPIPESETGPITNPTLAIGSTAEQWKTGTFTYRIADTNYTKTTVAAGAAFSAAHVVSASKYGVILCYINSSGTVSTKVPLATQAYTTAAAAHTAADAYDAIHRTSDLCYIGRILIAADAGDWTAITDDLTDGSDLTTATFLSETSSFYDLATCEFDADQITAHRAMWHCVNKNAKWVRHYLSVLTGTGEVNSWYDPAIGASDF